MFFISTNTHYFLLDMHPKSTSQRYQIVGAISNLPRHYKYRFRYFYHIIIMTIITIIIIIIMIIITIIIISQQTYGKGANNSRT